MSDSLSPKQRLVLIRLVNALPSPEFNALVFALQVPPGIVPANGAQGDRSSALLKWVEGPTGCKMAAFLSLLNDITPLPDELEQKAAPQSTQPANPSPPLRTEPTTKEPATHIHIENFAGAISTGSESANASGFTQNVANGVQQPPQTKNRVEPVTLPRYQQLESYMQQGGWEKANDETYRLMITTVGKSDGEWFSNQELLTFPRGELLIIDELWRRYSNDKFGFSVQKQIYVDCGGKLDGKYAGTKAWEAFGDRVGWRKDGEWNVYYSQYTFNTTAPKGHLPSLTQGKNNSLYRSLEGKMLYMHPPSSRVPCDIKLVSFLASRLANCSR